MRRTTLSNPVVLVHGLWFGGWCWGRVARLLRAGSRDVYAPSLTGTGDRAHLLRPGITLDTFGQDIASLLEFEDLRGVTLVSTSSGGLAAARAMEIAGERIGHAIFVDAVLPQPGERHGDVVPLFDWRSVHDPVTDSLRIPDDSQERLKAELAPCDLPWVMARRTGFPRAPISEAVGLERFWQGGWPVTIVRCIQSENPPESRQRHAAARLNAEWCELSSGHFPFITCPGALARIIAGRSA